MKRNDSQEWMLIIISQGHICHGENFIKLLELVKPLFKIQTCILDDDIDGTSKTNGFWDILNENQGVLSVVECIGFLSKVNLEWGNIFLFKNSIEDWEEFIEQDTHVKISQASLTFKAADGCHILIYTLDESLFIPIKELYPKAIIEKGKLVDLWDP